MNQGESVSSASLEKLRSEIERKLDELCMSFGADAGTYHFFDGRNDRLLFPVGVGLEAPHYFEQWLPSDHGPAATILAGGHPVFAEKAGAHPQFRGRFTLDENIKSGAAFPLHNADGRTSGIIFLNYRQERQFSLQDRQAMVEMVSAVGKDISELIEQGDLVPELRTHGGLRREHLALHRIAEDLCNLLPDTEAIIWVNEPSGYLVARGHSGFEAFSESIFGQRILNISDHFIGEVLVSDKEFIVAATDGRDPKWPDDSLHQEGARSRRWRSAIAFPVDQRAVLVAYTVEHAGMTKREQGIVKAFASQTRETIIAHERILAQEKLADVANKLNRPFESVEELLNEIVDTAAHLLNADWITLHQYDPAHNRFLDAVHSAVYPRERRDKLNTPRDEGGASAYVRDHGFIEIPDVDTADPDLVKTAHVMELGVKAYVGVQLRVENRLVGVLFFNYHAPRGFTRDDRTIIGLLADYAAAAINLTARQRDLKVLGDIGRKLASGLGLTTDAIVRLIHEQASRVMRMDNCFIALYDEQKRELMFPLMMKDGNPISMPARKFGEAGLGRTEVIIETRQHLFHRTRAEAEEWYEQPGHGEYVGTISSSWLGVPMVAGEHVIGVVATYDDLEDNAFEQADLEILTSIASSAAIALGNAQVYEKLIDRLREEQERRVRVEVDLRSAEMTRAMAHHIKGRLGSARVYLGNVRDGGHLSDTQLYQLQRAAGNIERCVEITLRLFKPFQPSQRDEATVSFLINEAIDKLEKATELAIEIADDVATLPKVWVERDLTIDFLHELLKNAVKAVTMGLDKGSISSGWISIGSKVNSSGNVDIYLANNGIPVPPELLQQDKLFGQFSSYSDTAREESTGLGLWGAKSFFQRIGGDVRLLDSNDTDTTFVVTLPVERAVAM